MDNYVAIIISAVCLVLLILAYKFLGVDKAQKWLVWAVTQAETLYGSGTGKLKLSYVYNLFVSKFPKLQIIIPYALFVKMVDVALVTMREMLKNDKIVKLVEGDKNDI